MTHHLIANIPPSTDPPPLRQFPRLEASLPLLDLDRRLQFAQRLAVLIRRIHTQPQIRAKEEPPDES